ncbi:MAG TPA: Fe-S cluster assembly protein SufD [Steroidobacteraceae bacterium]|nr:Fe-S cluster assembly protein SufD [Steroidobacteraceae bacterium]
MTAAPATPRSPALERYKQLFDARSLPNDALTQLRRAAFARFLASGFPTQRDERWKYTNLRRLESRTFALPEAAPVAPDASRWIPHVGQRIVFVDGQWMPSLSNPTAQPPGVTVLTIGQWLKHDATSVARFLSQGTSDPENAFENLNTAFFEDGVVVEVAPDTILDEPLYIVHHWQSSGRMVHPRIVIRAGQHSRVTVIEHYLGVSDAECFTNAVVTIDANPGAHVKHYRLQQEGTKSFHIGTIRARLAQDAKYSSHDIALGATIGRSDITTILEGHGADTKLRGLFAPAGTQHLDSYTKIEHVAPHTTSEEEYRGVADGRGRGIFNGKVKVHPHAQKIDARQLSRNLLLSPTAEIDTKPELEIYANDVKCSHGATTGQLDATALFYLRSRGLDADEARMLLIRAFAESILSTIEPKGLRAALEAWLRERFTNTEARV